MSFLFDTNARYNNPLLAACACFNNGKKKLEIMNNGQLVYWYRNSESDQWSEALIYASQEDYNENNWTYKGEVDPLLGQPCGFGVEYCVDIQDVVDVQRLSDFEVTTYCGDAIYYGDFIYNDGCGKGKIVYSNGDVYEGGVDAYIRNGYGKYVSSKGHGYEGTWSNSLIHGFGTMKFRNGSVYTGEWKNDYEDGHGTYICDLYTYAGDFYKGKAHGVGIQTWTDGATYEGNFVDDNMNGQGTYTCKNYVYIGEFVDDLSEGFGKITWKNGNSYEGKFVDDIIDLYYDDGVFTFADGSKYIGRLNKIWDVIVNSDEHKM